MGSSLGTVTSLSHHDPGWVFNTRRHGSQNSRRFSRLKTKSSALNFWPSCSVCLSPYHTLSQNKIHWKPQTLKNTSEISCFQDRLGLLWLENSLSSICFTFISLARTGPSHLCRPVSLGDIITEPIHATLTTLFNTSCRHRGRPRHREIWYCNIWLFAVLLPFPLCIEMGHGLRKIRIYLSLVMLMYNQSLILPVRGLGQQSLNG